GWNIGVHFDATSSIPFDATGTPAAFTANGSGMPTVGMTLSVSTSSRTYSISATGSSTPDTTAPSAPGIPTTIPNPTTSTTQVWNWASSTDTGINASGINR